jgi:putative ABC transport system ATP-binding protein
MTAVENVALPLLIDGESRSKCQVRADEMLKLVGLADRRDHKPEQLSGGEQQRVAIARALVTQPDIVLADEPTGNLDSRAGEEIVKLLRQASTETGQTIVMVTHDTHASSYADRIVFLKDGGIEGETHLTDENGADAVLKKLVELEM